MSESFSGNKTTINSICWSHTRGIVGFSRKKSLEFYFAYFLLLIAICSRWNFKIYFGIALFCPRKNFFQFVLIRLLPADILTISIMMININKTMIRHKCDLLITVRLNYLISVYGLQKISFYAHACVACVSIGHQKAES